jgi:glycosyltransferase involved in cell wall biosynthesis
MDGNEDSGEDSGSFLKTTPRVSVVIATWNRSEVLKHAIRSVLASTFTEWEMIVVGDACTDDTEECVASFGDARIRFVNLPQNSGGQSRPNNHGITLARGNYVAFLNHDDLYLTHHLTACVAELDRGEADLVWVAAAVAHASPRAAHPLTFTLEGVPPAGGYSPFAFYSASTWMFRRELADSVGPWQDASSLYVTPSQAWLFRAWRSGARLRFLPRVGVVVIWSGVRPDSYAIRESRDHELLARWMREDADFPARMLEDAAIDAARTAIGTRHHAPGGAIARLLARPIYNLLIVLGIHPSSLGMFIRHGRKGGFIRHHRRFTGIEQSTR